LNDAASERLKFFSASDPPPPALPNAFEAPKPAAALEKRFVSCSTATTSS
jgi:hypothetical protein